MRHIRDKRGSNLVFCIMLVALLGLLAGGYGLLLSYNTNSSVSQREFQQEYLTADSLRQSVVNSVLTGQNPLLADMKDKITAAIDKYLAYKQGYDTASAQGAAAEQAYILANGTPEYRLMELNDTSLSYHGESAVGSATAAVDTQYDVDKHELTVTVNYTGSEHYVLSALLKANGTPVSGGSGIHIGQSGLIDYTAIPGYTAAQALSQKQIKQGITCNTEGGDCYFLTAPGNNSALKLDVSTISITGSNRLFLVVPAGHSLTLSGQMDSDYTGQLIILQSAGGNGSGKLTLSPGLVFYGQIHMPNSQLTAGGKAEIYGTITVGSVKNSASNLTVEERFQGFEGTGIGSLADLGGYWNNAGTTPIGGAGDPARDTSYDHLADLTGWEEVRYYEG